MSLNFDLDRIEHYESLCWIETDNGPRINPVTEALIFHTMHIGMNAITKANAVEFTDRVTKFERAVGPSLTRWDETTAKPVGCPITAEDVLAHRGLHTNASVLARTAFNKALLAAI